MSDWEADDFDCTSQVTDKLVALGLDAALKTENNESQDEDLTEKQKLGLQMQSDAEIGLELLGVEQKKPKSWDDMRKKTDYIQFAEDIGRSISLNFKNPNYTIFVNSLLHHICEPMTKLQLETVNETVNSYINKITKKEDEVKEEIQQKENAKAKKAKHKKLLEDTIEDEYDSLDEKFFS